MEKKEFEGRTYIPSKDAAKRAKLNQDYIGQLCRGGKLMACRVGRNWYVCEASLTKYVKTGDGTLPPLSQKESLPTTEGVAEKKTTPVSEVRSSHISNTTSKKGHAHFDFSIPQIVSREHLGAVMLGLFILVTTLFVSSSPELAPSHVVASLAQTTSSYASEAGSYVVEAFLPITSIIKGIDRELGFSESIYVAKAKHILSNLSDNARRIYDPAPAKALAFRSMETFTRFYIIPAKYSLAKAQIFGEKLYSQTTTQWEGIVHDATITPMNVFARNNPDVVERVSNSQVAVVSFSLVAGTIDLANEFWFSAKSTFAWVHDAVVGAVQKIRVALSDVPKNPQSLEVTKTDQNRSHSVGLVVTNVPAESSADAEIEKVKKSFSDEVIVTKDESGGAGIITPVFKERTGDDYVYVMVPLQEEYEK